MIQLFTFTHPLNFKASSRCSMPKAQREISLRFMIMTKCKVTLSCHDDPQSIKSTETHRLGGVVSHFFN